MSLIWNTESGECSFTVTASHTAPANDDPADPISVGAYPWDTNGANDVVNPEGFGHDSSAGQLDIGVHAVNSLMRYFPVDDTIKVKATKTSITVSRSGDQHPDMKVVQYRPSPTRFGRTFTSGVKDRESSLCESRLQVRLGTSGPLPLPPWREPDTMSCELAARSVWTGSMPH
ncbi:hypothetical protein [Streptomyces sp. NPDC051219]|uniref:hypothetical protein n=1 Tax=Streptomyces sp. NPDC051219 TaxID=3155283 RepID=UPI00341F847A